MAANTWKKEKVKYIHFVPPVKLNPRWPNEFRFVLVETVDHLRSIFQDFMPNKTMFALDFETSDLSPENGFIVGAAISFDGVTGYYIPINHYDPTYNLGDEALDMIYDYCVQAARVFLFNVRFDFRFFEYHGYKKELNNAPTRLGYVKYDMSKVKYYDVSVGVWNADTNIKMPSLKNSSLHFLGIKQQSFEETLYGVSNFYYVDPQRAAFYGGSDAICTFLLAGTTLPYYKEAKHAGEIDNEMLYSLMHYENEKILLDSDHLLKIDTESKERLVELEKEIYQKADYVFSLNSPKQVAEVFQRAGLDTGKYTATGYMSTGIDLLENLDAEVLANYPVVESYVEYKRLFKAHSSYIKVLKKEDDERGYLRCNYKTQQVPTGRLASGADAKNSFFSEINIHSIPKPKPAMYYVVDLRDRSLYSKKEYIIMGYQFVPVNYHKVVNEETGEIKKEMVSGSGLYGASYLGIIEGASNKLNVRNAFLPLMSKEEAPEDWLFLSIDYAAQEIRLPANFSLEPIWVEAFVHDEDIHKKVAMEVFAGDYNKEQRRRAKGVNFGILYGLTPQNFSTRYNTTLREAEEFFDKYKSALPKLFAWQARLQARARKLGTVYTYFSRPRRVKFYFDNSQVGFGYRTISNSVVQGTASDILKISLIKLWKKAFNHKDYKNDVRFITNVHDEIDFAVRTSKIQEIFPILLDCMRFSLPEWPVVLEVEGSIGFSWGSILPFVYDKDTGKLVPKVEK